MVQEKMQCMAMGSMPQSMKVILMDEMTDCCKSGGMFLNIFLQRDAKLLGFLLEEWKLFLQQMTSVPQMMWRSQAIL